MKNDRIGIVSIYLIIVLCAVVLVSCGGGGSDGSVAPERPVGIVGGTAFDGLIINGDVSVYDFSDGVRGKELISGTTNNIGEYSLSLKSSDVPILICVKGGRYIEEASGRNVPISSDQEVCAVHNYISGESLSTSLTYYTNLAAGLAEYFVSVGKPVAEAISEANKRLSNLIQIDTTKTVPLDITDSINATTVATDSHLYGFATAAISSLTQFISAQNDAVEHSIYNSILFVQKSYDDIKADGVLNGQGVNGVISFGIVPVTTETYRHALASNMFVIVSSARNATGLTSRDILNNAIALNDSTDPVFNNQIPVSFNSTTPVIANISIADNDVLSQTIVISADIADITGVAGVEIRVDGEIVAPFMDGETVSLNLDTTKYADGPHTIELRAENIFNGIKIETINVFFANEQTVISNISPIDSSFVRGQLQLSANVTDPIGINSVSLLVNGKEHSLASDNENPVFTVDTAVMNDGASDFTIKAINTVPFEKVQTVTYTIDNESPTAVFNSHAEGFLLQGLETFQITADDNLGLKTVEVLLSGVQIAKYTDFTSSLLPFVMDTSIRPNSSHKLTISAVDNAGNTKIVELNGYLDNSDPPLMISSPIEGEGVKGDFNIIANASDDVGLSSVEILIDDVHFAYPSNINLPNQLVNSNSFTDGPHKITVIATANSGRETSQSVNIFIDNSAPTLTWVVNSCTSIKTASSCCADCTSCYSDISIGIKVTEPHSPWMVEGLWANNAHGNCPTCSISSDGVLTGVASTGFIDVVMTATNLSGLSVRGEQRFGINGFDQCFLR